MSSHLLTFVFLSLSASLVLASDPWIQDGEHPSNAVPALGLLNSDGDGEGNIGHTLGVNPFNLDNQGHVDVQLAQVGVDPMLVGPNYRLGNILKLEGGPFGPIGGPLNPHVGPYYGMKGHRFHSAHQADRILSGTEGPLPTPTVPSPLIHPFVTNQYSNPLAVGTYSQGTGYGYGYGAPGPAYGYYPQSGYGSYYSGYGYGYPYSYNRYPGFPGFQGYHPYSY